MRQFTLVSAICSPLFHLSPENSEKKVTVGVERNQRKTEAPVKARNHQKARSSSSKKIGRDSERKEMGGFLRYKTNIYIGTASVSKRRERNPREKAGNQGAWIMTWEAREQTEGSRRINALYQGQTGKDRWQAMSLSRRQKN